MEPEFDVLHHDVGAGCWLLVLGCWFLVAGQVLDQQLNFRLGGRLIEARVMGFQDLVERLESAIVEEGTAMDDGLK